MASSNESGFGSGVSGCVAEPSPAVRTSLGVRIDRLLAAGTLPHGVSQLRRNKWVNQADASRFRELTRAAFAGWLISF